MINMKCLSKTQTLEVNEGWFNIDFIELFQRFLESFFWDSVDNFSKQIDHIDTFYSLKNTTNKSKITGSTEELKLKEPFTLEALGGGKVVVVVVVVVVVGGGGLGSWLQHMLGRVVFPPLLSGQQ